MPVPWLPPPFPDITGYVDWQLERYDLVIKRHRTKIYLPWRPTVDLWTGSRSGQDWSLDVTIGPPTHEAPLTVDVFHWEVNAPMLHTTWSANLYLLGEPWQSGTKLLNFPADNAWTWQTFHTVSG